MAAQVPIQIAGRDQQQLRLDEKLRRELGEPVLAALADHRSEDVCLNPDGKLWANRQGDGWKQIGELSPKLMTVPRCVAIVPMAACAWVRPSDPGDRTSD